MYMLRNNHKINTHVAITPLKRGHYQSPRTLLIPSLSYSPSKSKVVTILISNRFVLPGFEVYMIRIILFLFFCLLCHLLASTFMSWGKLSMQPSLIFSSVWLVHCMTILCLFLSWVLCVYLSMVPSINIYLVFSLFLQIKSSRTFWHTLLIHVKYTSMFYISL